MPRLVALWSWARTASPRRPRAPDGVAVGCLKHRLLEPGIEHLLDVEPPLQDAALGEELDLEATRRLGTKAHRDGSALRDDSVVRLLCELAVGMPDGVAKIVLDVNPAANVADHEVRPAELGAEVAFDIPIDRILGVIGAVGHSILSVLAASVFRVGRGRDRDVSLHAVDALDRDVVGR